MRSTWDWARRRRSATAAACRSRIARSVSFGAPAGCRVCDASMDSIKSPLATHTRSCSRQKGPCGGDKQGSTCCPQPHY